MHKLCILYVVVYAGQQKQSTRSSVIVCWALKMNFVELKSRFKKNVCDTVARKARVSSYAEKSLEYKFKLISNGTLWSHTVLKCSRILWFFSFSTDGFVYVCVSLFLARIICLNEHEKVFVRCWTISVCELMMQTMSNITAQKKRHFMVAVKRKVLIQRNSFYTWLSFVYLCA